VGLKGTDVFFALWRSLLLREGEFVRLMMSTFRDMSEQFGDVERRAVQVHGPAAGAFMAAVRMFGDLVPAADMNGFISFLRGKCVTASEQRELAVNVNQFWVDLISAFGRGVFGETKADRQRFFKVMSRVVEHPPMAVNKDESGHYVQGTWIEYTLFIEMNGVLDLMRKDLRQQGKMMVLDKADLIEQMSRRPYYSDRNRAEHGARQRFGEAKMPLRCLAIDVDKMGDFGYRPVSDAALEESWLAEKQRDLPGTEPQIRVASDKWIDPRKGDLYSIIEVVKSDRNEE
jgi:hypothetical protein